MPRSCNVFGCRGNYPGQPYSKVVSFPDKSKELDEWKRWISAMPNDRASLESLKEIWVCTTHFDCAWKTIRGGSRPVAPPSIFPGVRKSCLKQTSSKARSTSATSEKRMQNDAERVEARNKINNFESFTNEIGAR